MAIGREELEASVLQSYPKLAKWATLLDQGKIKLRQLEWIYTELASNSDGLRIASALSFIIGTEHRQVLFNHIVGELIVWNKIPSLMAFIINRETINDKESGLDWALCDCRIDKKFYTIDVAQRVIFSEAFSVEKVEKIINGLMLLKQTDYSTDRIKFLYFIYQPRLSKSSADKIVNYILSNSTKQLDVASQPYHTYKVILSCPPEFRQAKIKEVRKSPTELQKNSIWMNATDLIEGASEDQIKRIVKTMTPLSLYNILENCHRDCSSAIKVLSHASKVDSLRQILAYPIDVQFLGSKNRVSGVDQSLFSSLLEFLTTYQSVVKDIPLELLIDEGIIDLAKTILSTATKEKANVLLDRISEANRQIMGIRAKNQTIGLKRQKKFVPNSPLTGVENVVGLEKTIATIVGLGRRFRIFFTSINIINRCGEDRSTKTREVRLLKFYLSKLVTQSSAAILFVISLVRDEVVQKELFDFVVRSAVQASRLEVLLYIITEKNIVLESLDNRFDVARIPIDPEVLAGRLHIVGRDRDIGNIEEMVKQIQQNCTGIAEVSRLQALVELCSLSTSDGSTAAMAIINSTARCQKNYISGKEIFSSHNELICSDSTDSAYRSLVKRGKEELRKHCQVYTLHNVANKMLDDIDDSNYDLSYLDEDIVSKMLCSTYASSDVYRSCVVKILIEARSFVNALTNLELDYTISYTEFPEDLEDPLEQKAVLLCYYRRLLVPIRKRMTVTQAQDIENSMKDILMVESEEDSLSDRISDTTSQIEELWCLYNY